MNVYEIEVLAKQHHQMLLKIAEEDRLVKAALPERNRMSLRALIQRFFRRDIREAKVEKTPCCAAEALAGDV